jgi:type II secretory pathway component PulJ
LIEFLIATAIFSIIIVSVYASFQTGILSYRGIDAAFQTYQTARVVLNRLESDIKNSFAYFPEDSQFKGNSCEIEFLGVIDKFSGKALPQFAVSNAS